MGIGNDAGSIAQALGEDAERCASALRSSLQQCTSVFQKLALLAGTRDESSGSYRDPRLETICGVQQADSVLRREHVIVFRDWLCLKLESQAADVVDYVEHTEQHNGSLESWAVTRWYQRLIPEEVAEVERTLYLKDMEMVILALQKDRGRR